MLTVDYLDSQCYNYDKSNVSETKLVKPNSKITWNLPKIT